VERETECEPSAGIPVNAPDPLARRRVRLAWLAVALCIALILLFSGEDFAAGNTSRFLGPIMRWLFPQLSADALYRVHVLVRKTAHVTEYALLGLLVFRALRLSLAVSLPRVALLGLALVLCVAATDELRQSFLPSRTGALTDVGLDVLGGILGLGVIVAAHRAAGIGAPAPPPERRRA
jgi:VanZ family protein